jgi:hypothetical protein
MEKKDPNDMTREELLKIYLKGKAYQKTYRETHIRNLEYQKEWKLKNPDYQKEWRLKNKERLNKYRKEYVKKEPLSLSEEQAKKKAQRKITAKKCYEKRKALGTGYITKKKIKEEPQSSWIKEYYQSKNPTIQGKANKKIQNFLDSLK